MRGGIACLFAVLVAGCAVERREPFVPSPPFGRVALVCATSMGGWATALGGLGAVEQDRLIAIPEFDAKGAPEPGGLYAWARDAWVFGWVGGRPAAILAPGQRPLQDWARKHLESVGVRLLSAGHARPWPDERFDAGGNMVVSPPATEGHRFGLIIVGRDMQEPLKAFFRRERVQAGADGALVELDTSWLRTGHVDELVGFVPCAGAPGFRLVLPDPVAALKLVKAAPPDRVLFYAVGSKEVAGTVTAAGPRYMEDRQRGFSGSKWAYVRITAGKGAGQVARISRGATGLQLRVEQVWDLRDPRRDDSATTGLRSALAGRCDTMPVWFETPDATSRYVMVEGTQFWLDGAGEQVPALVTAGELARDRALARAVEFVDEQITGDSGAERGLRDALGPLRDADVVRLPVLYVDDGHGGDAWALTPNPVNLVVLGQTVVVLTPFGPRESAWDDRGDVFQRAITKALASPGLNVRFVDGWGALHAGNGGARCGTNVLCELPGEADAKRKETGP